MSKIILSKDKYIQCEKCGHSATPEEMKHDRMRMHQTRSGILCELCHEDYLDARADCED